MSNLYRGPSIDASYQISVHLAEGFQRRRLKCEKLTNDRRQVMAKAHFALVKLLVFGNNSKTVNNIRNLTGVKMISTARSNYPEILKKI
jgi:hypothetical protein